MERYIFKNGKKLRYGYTTGTCSTAATLAALKMIKTQSLCETVNLDVPKGWNIDIPIINQEFSMAKARAGVIKDSGDDPDVTNGIEIVSEVEIKSGSGNIYIDGGIGVGRVKKKGLGFEIGQAAINKVPMRMIREVAEVYLEADKDIFITISVPEGETIALRTFNEGVGIVGGISIIGTTGIVEPMSQDAFRDSIALELKILKANGAKHIILSPGNYGIDFAASEGIDLSCSVKYSNFLGDTLEKCMELEFEEITIIGNLGKMIKVAGGIFNTHSRIADGRKEIMTAYTLVAGGSKELAMEIMDTLTTDEGLEKIDETGLLEAFSAIVGKEIHKRIQKYIYGGINIHLKVFSNKYGMLYESE